MINVNEAIRINIADIELNENNLCFENTRDLEDASNAFFPFIFKDDYEMHFCFLDLEEAGKYYKNLRDEYFPSFVTASHKIEYYQRAVEPNDINDENKNNCGIRKEIDFNLVNLCRNSNWIVSDDKFEATF